MVGAIELTQCYFADSQEACDMYPVRIVIPETRNRFRAV